MIYLITGATCSGKDKLAEYMETELNIRPVISTTSRPIRPKEVEGKEYHFVLEEEFLQKVRNNEMLELRHYDTVVGGKEERWHYGTEKSSLPLDDRDILAVTNWEGVKAYIEAFGREKIKLIFITSTYSDRFVRNVLRGDYDPEEWVRRNKDDEEWLEKVRREADYIIYNHGFDKPENPNLGSPIDIADYVEGFDMTVSRLIYFLRKEGREI